MSLSLSTVSVRPSISLSIYLSIYLRDQVEVGPRLHLRLRPRPSTAYRTDALLPDLGCKEADAHK